MPSDQTIDPIEISASAMILSLHNSYGTTPILNAAGPACDDGTRKNKIRVNKIRVNKVWTRTSR